MKRLITITAALALLAPASAQAVRLVTPQGKVAQPYQRWANRAKVPTPPGSVIVVLAHCAESEPNIPACYRVGPPRTIWLDPAMMRTLASAGEAREQFFHELYHDFDETGMLTNADRAQFERIMRLRGPWRTTDHDSSPNEAFADAGASCAIRVRVNEWTVPFETQYQPTVRQHRRVCRLINRAGLS